MRKPAIPQEVKDEAVKRIEHFNKTELSHLKDKVWYLAEFKGKNLHLKRKEYEHISPVARLTYTGNINEWDFAIFKWSDEEYDPDEDWFPGVQHVDGTIEGAMKAGMDAYPV